MLHRQHETWFDEPGTAVAAIGILISSFRPFVAVSVFLLPLVVVCDGCLVVAPLATATEAPTWALSSTHPA